MPTQPLNLNLVRAARAYATLGSVLPSEARILGNMATHPFIVEERQIAALRVAIQRAWSRDDVKELGEFIRGLK